MATTSNRSDKDDIQPSLSTTRPPLRILTVGDGDLTLSLSLARAYGPQIEVTASTLCSTYQELCQTYSNSASVVRELITDHKARVLYGIDATKLSAYPSLLSGPVNTGRDQIRGYDLILFHHPHLGLMTSKNSTDEQHHAQRHFVLLAHYFASAKSLLESFCCRSNGGNKCNNDPDNLHSLGGKNDYYDGRIHLCLAHDQPQTWQIEKAARMQGLKLVKFYDTSAPFHEVVKDLNLSQSIVTNDSNKQRIQQVQDGTASSVSSASTTSTTPTVELTLLPQKHGFAAPRRYRNGKLGSKHFLGKYGYQHRRTYGDMFDGNSLDMNVQGSKHYFFAIDNNESKEKTAIIGNAEHSSDSNNTVESHCCTICGLSFVNEESLQNHLKAPALPDPPSVEHDCSAKKSMDEKPQTNNQTEVGKGKGRDGKGHSATLSSNNNTSWNVLEEHQGNRLRQFLKKIALPSRSKKQRDRLVVQGHVQVNGSVAHDTGRILHAGDVVELVGITEEGITTKLKTIEYSAQPDIPIVATFPPCNEGGDGDNGNRVFPPDFLVVANKPSGMRPRGDYESSRTLEQLVTWQLNKEGKYKNLSTLETGCVGLCVLQREQTDKGTNAAADVDIVVHHEFTVLVHGHVPSEWDHGVSVEVPWRSVRLWRRRRDVHSPEQRDVGQGQEHTDNPNVDENDEEDEEGPEASNCNDGDKPWMMNIICVERTSLKRRSQDDKPAPALSTLKIYTACTAFGLCRAICLHLRQEKHPVVADRCCQKEYQGLPRSLRNRIKNKLCLGCFAVKVDVINVDCDTIIGFNSSVEIPDKLKASYWQEHWQSAPVVPNSNGQAYIS